MKVILIADLDDRQDDVKDFYDAVCDEAAKTPFKFLHLDICYSVFQEGVDET